MSSPAKVSMHFNLRDFILEVEKRESLWANKHKNDRFRKAQDWMEVVRTLSIDNWDRWSKGEKDEMIEYAQRKWRSIRDNIVKQVRRQEKTNIGCPQQRKAPYIYYDICKFLLPEIPAYGRSFVWAKMNKHIENSQKNKQIVKQEVDNQTSSDDEIDLPDPLAGFEESESDSEDEPLMKKAARKAESPQSKPSPTRTTRQTTTTPVANTKSSIMKAEAAASSSSTKVNAPSEKSQNNMNEDEAFFLSLMPSVQKLSDEQKMEFRISVLKLLKELKQNASSRNTNTIVQELFDF